MKHKVTNAPVLALDALLEEERSALLQGDLDGVAALFPDKEALVTELNDAVPGSEAQMTALATKVRRNQKLLQGGMDGIRTVKDRLAALQRVRDTLETYGADGKRQSVSTDTRTTVERRA